MTSMRDYITPKQRLKIIRNPLFTKRDIVVTILFIAIIALNIWAS